MQSNTQDELDDTRENVDIQWPRKYISSKSAQTVCFVLILLMNLRPWIDTQGVYVELPLITPLTPEGWTLPSVLALCICAANIGPVLLVLLRWRQGKRFSEIPYIYIIIIIGIVSCCVMGVSWQKTILLFGRERSIWLFGTIVIMALLDCTSSLVFFDYMKRFRAHYLTAVFLGEGFTTLLPLMLALLQGVGSEIICVSTANNTIPEPVHSQPRFSVTVFLFCIAGIILLPLAAFILLRWTNIVSLADAVEPNPLKNTRSSVPIEQHESIPIASDIQSSELQPTLQMSSNTFIFLLFLNGVLGAMLYGCMSSLSSYSLLPFGQKTYYYSTLISQLAHPIACLLSLRWPRVTTHTIIVESIIGLSFCIFIICIACQSPCPWMADTLHGSLIIINIWFLATLILAYVRITIGNRIKNEWIDEKGMFYFGTSLQIGIFVGTIPMFILINIFGVFVERLPCQMYCTT